MVIDDTYYVGIPSVLNITRSLGFANLGDAQAAMPALVKGQIYR
jgi:hypothetical protein